ncbi:MAG: hypothetical protein M1825_003800 [Sarcosagium campestre]|nr:MAG: hypothetical protein M1825_003800 [Sarcosagium campestre]
MDTTSQALSVAHEIYARSGVSGSDKDRPSSYKAIGIALAVASGVFIGTSFVLKKVGLLKANKKYEEEAGEGYGYLKNLWWWSGMTLMIIGEICNFVAYAFVDAILVTPFGALSVVITTILSAIFLKERLSFVGKVGCLNCIIGAVVIGINAPTQSSVKTIQDMKDFVLAPGFLTYAGLVIVGCTFIAFWAGPRYGKKSMMVYISICSLIGGLSVVATQGLGAAIVTQAGGEAQFNQWFLYVLLVFVIATLLTEIIFLNKALNIFNAALVTPTYYVFFTSATIVTSAILFKGFKGKPAEIISVVMGFLQICTGVVLLQLSKSAKDVPDTAVFKGDLDQVRTVAEQEEPESEPKADAIRGAAALIRRISVSRQKREEEEFNRYHEERLKDLEPIGEDEVFEWDGLRRRRTTIAGSPHPGGLARTKTLHPPLGLTHFPDEDEERVERSSSDGAVDREGVFGTIRRKARSAFSPHHGHDFDGSAPDADGATHPVRMTSISMPPRYEDSTIQRSGSHDGAQDAAHVYGLPASLQRPRDRNTSRSSSRVSPGQGTPIRLVHDDGEAGLSRSHLAPKTPPHSAKRTFSFQNLFHRRGDDQKSYDGSSDVLPSPRKTLASRQGSHAAAPPHGPTEEERLGLVKGDSTAQLPNYSSDDEWQLGEKTAPQRPSASEPAAAPPALDADRDASRRGERGTRRGTSRGAEDVARSQRISEEEWERQAKDWESKQDGDDGGGGGGGKGSFI